MVRQIIHIDEEKCNGCGICAEACHEGAIDIVDGKAKLVREHFCDGFGDCLPGCPMGAITFEEREAPAYDEEAVKASQAEKKVKALEDNRQGTCESGHGAGCENGNTTGHEAGHAAEHGDGHRAACEKGHPTGNGTGHKAGHGCPGSRFMKLNPDAGISEAAAHAAGPGFNPSAAHAANSGFDTSFSHGSSPSVSAVYGQAPKPVSRLEQWPCQIKLLPTQAPFYNGAKLLIAADCTAYAYANMHEDFMRGKVTLIGCPKLDAVDYSEKLTEIIARNDIKSVTIVRMEVPCCGGLQRAAEKALRASGKFIPWQVVTISRDGKILE